LKARKAGDDESTTTDDEGESIVLRSDAWYGSLCCRFP